MNREHYVRAYDMWNGVASLTSIEPSTGVAAAPTSLARPQMKIDTRRILGKRDGTGQRRTANPVNRGGSRYRGVTHHARTNRYESHIWDEGRQIYLGGFYNEDQAALAYDLAAVRFRGEDAITNYEAHGYDEELEERHRYTREQIVSCLREQSKAMNKVTAAAAPAVMEPWEVAISAVLQPNKVHIGVFETELQAARAYDRGLIMSLGLEAAQLLNFELIDYLDALTPHQVDLAVRQGLLPAEVAANYLPPPCPRPLFQIEGALPITVDPQWVPIPSPGSIEVAEQRIAAVPVLRSEEKKEVAADEASPGPVVRRKSTTPRSVFDFEEDAVIHVVAATGAEQQRGDEETEQPAAKRHKAASEENFEIINTVVL